MTSLIWPQPQSGPRPDVACALTGRADLWFDSVRRRVPGSDRWSGAHVSHLDSGELRRICAPRPAIVGLSLDRPHIMGILNVTPDSFSDGGDRLARATALEAAKSMDADIIDIGGESTRPGADPVPERAEIDRVVPVIEELRSLGISAPISVDTRKAQVAAAALDAGATLVNDVSALSYDSAMVGLIAERTVPVCLMHSLGDPKTMQQNPAYQDVLVDVFTNLAGRIAWAVDQGIAIERIIADPGIGFGKTLEHNLILLKGLALFHSLGVPLLLGASRKRFIGTLGNADAPKDRMAGSLAVGLHGVSQGAHILRVHDVTETRQAIALWQALQDRGSSENE